MLKIDWKGLLQGMYNAVAGKEWIKKLAAYRFEEFCKDCVYNSTNAKARNGYTTIRPDEHCTRCGCNLEWKTHQLSSSCPINKWKAEVTPAEADMIQAKLAAKADS